MWNFEGAITGTNEAFLHMVRYDADDIGSGRVCWTELTPPHGAIVTDNSIRSRASVPGILFSDNNRV